MDNPLLLDFYIIDVIKQLQAAGYECYLVGGAVRDLLLGRVPKDFDISTSATPEQVRKVFRHQRTMIIGRRFRLVHLYRGNDITEISTFRKCPTQEQQTDRPRRFEHDTPENMIFHDNEFGTAADDAFRRDFTVNAIFYDPASNTIKDFTGLGESDLRDGIVRTIGNPVLRFQEDPVRILRAIKLVGQYGFKMEPETDRAVRSNLELIKLASPARLNLEMEKILKNPYAADIFRAFRAYGFLKYYLPALDRQYDTPMFQYALQLLDMRRERILAGLYRASLSTAVAMIALPFVEADLGHNGVGGLWTYEPGIETLIKGIIRGLLAPNALTHRTTIDALTNIMLQPVFFRRNDALHGYLTRNGYANAREFALIQNLVAWHIDDFESFYESDNIPTGWPAKSKRKRHHTKRGRSQHKLPPMELFMEATGNTPDTPAQTFTTAPASAEAETPAPAKTRRKRKPRKPRTETPAANTPTDASVSD